MHEDREETTIKLIMVVLAAELSRISTGNTIKLLVYLLCNSMSS